MSVNSAVQIQVLSHVYMIADASTKYPCLTSKMNSAMKSSKMIHNTYHQSEQLQLVEPSQHHPSLLEQRLHIHVQLYQPAVTTDSCSNLS